MSGKNIFYYPLSGSFLALTLLLSNTKVRADSASDRPVPQQDVCYPQPDSKQLQYIIGYGSLMQDASRQRTAPNAGTAYPVMVQGYRRGWFARGGSVGFDATYLGIVPDRKASINAVIYQIRNLEEIAATDKREYFYCRQLVPNSTFSALGGYSFPSGQAWIYVNRPESMAKPTEKYPIVQSYVDIFVSGCLEQQQRYNLPDFANQCITTTTEWSGNWVNDRIYPRRPFLYEPKASQIDKLLKEKIPQYFEQIRIE